MTLCKFQGSLVPSILTEHLSVEAWRAHAPGCAAFHAAPWSFRMVYRYLASSEAFDPVARPCFFFFAGPFEAIGEIPSVITKNSSSSNFSHI